MCEGITCRVLSRRVTPKINKEDQQTSGYILGLGNCTGCSPAQNGMLWFTGSRCPCCNQQLRHWPRKGNRKINIKKAQENVTEEYREMMSIRMEVLICSRNISDITYKQFMKIYKFEIIQNGQGNRWRQMRNDKRLKELFRDFVLPSGL